VGTFHAALRHARKAAAAARRRAELPESAAAARPFCRRRRRGATGLGLYSREQMFCGTFASVGCQIIFEGLKFCCCAVFL